MAIVSFLALIFLPGLGVLWAFRRMHPGDRAHEESESRFIELARAVAISLCLVLLIGGALVSLTQFSGTRLALALLPFTIMGTLAVPALVRAIRGEWLSVLITAVFAVPFMSPAVRGGLAPINNFNWYYWLLGRDLDTAQGIPTWVAEYDMQVRWQPDYLTFNFLTDAFRALFPWSDAEALAAWKAPLALFVALLCYASLRLWLSQTVAVVGTALLLASTPVVTKLGNGRPEAIGFAVGLAALILGVEALRRRKVPDYALAGVLLGIAASVHAIGALPPALLLAAASLWYVAIGLRSEGLAIARLVVTGGAACAAVILATGWALQGRLFVGQDAANPTMSGGQDPTLDYFRLTEDLQQRPDLSDRLKGMLSDVIPAVPTEGTLAIVGLAVLVFAVVTCCWKGSELVRELSVLAVGSLIILGLGTAWFALRYETFVPQNTGLSRFVQWAPLFFLLALCAALQFLVEVAAAAVKRRQVTAHSRPRRSQTIAAAILLAGVGAWVIAAQLPEPLELTAEGSIVLQQVSDHAQEGDVVLSSPVSHGMLEYFTDVEAPVEGRQPLIERPDVLKGTNDYLSRVTNYFSNPRGKNASRLFEAHWVLAVDEPELLGGIRTFGPPRSELTGAPGLTPVWRGTHATLYRATGAQDETPRVSSGTVAWPWRFGAVVALLLLLVAGRRLVRVGFARRESILHRGQEGGTHL